VIEEIRRFAAGQPPLHPILADDMARVA
jgi:hypothetical protein